MEKKERRGVEEHNTDASVSNETNINRKRTKRSRRTQYRGGKEI
jgi:hypothetical protein